MLSGGPRQSRALILRAYWILGTSPSMTSTPCPPTRSHREITLHRPDLSGSQWSRLTPFGNEVSTHLPLPHQAKPRRWTLLLRKSLVNRRLPRLAPKRVLQIVEVAPFIGLRDVLGVDPAVSTRVAWCGLDPCGFALGHLCV